MKNKVKLAVVITGLSLALLACSNQASQVKNPKQAFLGSPRPALSQSQIITKDNEKYIGKSIYMETNEENTASTTLENSSREYENLSARTNILQREKLTKLETKANGDSYKIPGLILTGNSPVIFGLEDEAPFLLSKGDKISLPFEKYPSEIVDVQHLYIGLANANGLVDFKDFEDLSGLYEYQVLEDGEYFLYLESYSSDYLSIYDTSLKIEKANLEN